MAAPNSDKHSFYRIAIEEKSLFYLEDESEVLFGWDMRGASGLCGYLFGDDGQWDYSQLAFGFKNEFRVFSHMAVFTHGGLDFPNFHASLVPLWLDVPYEELWNPVA